MNYSHINPAIFHARPNRFIAEVDRCVLYTYRLAVWYTDNDGKLPANKQNWWNWKE
jgi:hypothetical protein